MLVVSISGNSLEVVIVVDVFLVLLATDGNLTELARPCANGLSCLERSLGVECDALSRYCDAFIALKPLEFEPACGLEWEECCPRKTVAWLVVGQRDLSILAVDVE